MRAKLSALALLGAGALQGCAAFQPPAYGPISETVRYGYKDRVNPDGGYTLLVVMPPQSPLPDVRTYWERRAAELCPGGNANRNIFRSERKEFMSNGPYVYRSVGVGSRTVTGYEIEGYVYCKAAAPAG